MRPTIDQQRQRLGIQHPAEWSKPRPRPKVEFTNREEVVKRKVCGTPRKLAVTAPLLEPVEKVQRFPRIRPCGPLTSDDLRGRRFGMLVALEPAYQRRVTSRVKKGGYTYDTFWRCQCDCGNKSDVARSQLLCGRTLSCGINGCKSKARKYRAKQAKAASHGKA